MGQTGRYYLGYRYCRRRFLLFVSVCYYLSGLLLTRKETSRFKKVGCNAEADCDKIGVLIEKVTVIVFKSFLSIDAVFEFNLGFRN
jgi:hypothetical protein